jgi:SAM-dependent methyltransferase
VRQPTSADDGRWQCEAWLFNEDWSHDATSTIPPTDASSRRASSCMTEESLRALLQSVTQSSKLDVNYRYLAHYVQSRKAAADGGSFRVLDYGCGDASLISELRACGVQCWGAERFYTGATYSNPDLERLLEMKVVRQIEEDGRIPFDDDFFELIYSNQVFEHVQNLGRVVDELSRVLSPTGTMYHHFPSREVLREGHIGIPLAHRLRPGAVRHAYTVVLHATGLGYHPYNGQTHREWADRSLHWLDEYCFYRPYAEVRAAFCPNYVIRHREIDYIRFRAHGRPLLSWVANRNVFAPACQRAFRRLAFMAIELTPKRLG